MKPPNCPNWNELQHSFAKALSTPSLRVPPPITSEQSPRPEKRFNIYRNNVFASLIEVLAGRYPAIETLVGEEYFAALAKAFIRAHPPRNPVMITYGGAFPNFLEQFEPLADLPYLPDVARLEWAWNTAYYAADATPLSPQDLAIVAPDEIARLVLQLHPSLSILSSPFPARSIWQASIDGKDLSGLKLDQGGEESAVVRPYRHVNVIALPNGASVFLNAIKQGAPLGVAVEQAMSHDMSFDFQANLTGLLSNGMLTGFTVTPA